MPPARWVNQRSAPWTTWRYSSSAPGTAPNAAQQSVVVLMLLRLSVVSPQPPSALTWRASQSRPRPMRSAERAVRNAGLFFSTTASAQVAVAVESALLESSPVQWPSGARRASNSPRAFSSASRSRWEKSKAQNFQGAAVPSRASSLAAGGLNVLFVAALALGQNCAGLFATEYLAQHVAVAADPGVHLFRHPDHPGNPEHQRQRNQQWHLHSHVTNAACATVNAAIRGHTVHGCRQHFGRQARRDFLGARIGHRQQCGEIEPVEPCQDAHLKLAHRALIVIQHNIRGAFHERE